MELNKAIFYIKYYAKKHDCIIERKAQLDDKCFEGHHKNLVILIKYMLMFGELRKQVKLNTEPQVINGK